VVERDVQANIDGVPGFPVSGQMFTAGDAVGVIQEKFERAQLV
jgi:hypothetical protein